MDNLNKLQLQTLNLIINQKINKYIFRYSKHLYIGTYYYL